MNDKIEQAFNYYNEKINYLKPAKEFYNKVHSDAIFGTFWSIANPIVYLSPVVISTIGSYFTTKGVCSIYTQKMGITESNICDSKSNYILCLGLGAFAFISLAGPILWRFTKTAITLLDGRLEESYSFACTTTIAKQAFDELSKQVMSSPGPPSESPDESVDRYKQLLHNYETTRH